MSEEWLTAAEAAAMLGLSEGSLRHRILRGRIDVVRDGRTVRIARSVVEAAPSKVRNGQRLDGSRVQPQQQPVVARRTPDTPVGARNRAHSR
jgi:excisionase family DNA binding protein